MTRILSATLVTLGDPERLTGGYLFHRRLANLAPACGARLDFVSVPDRPFPLAVADAPRVLRQARLARADALVVDSIAAAFVGPWLALRGAGIPTLGMLHQPPGGIDHGPVRARVQAGLDRLAYRRARLLLAASQSLAEELAARGLPSRRIEVVPPGRDVAPVAAPPPGDLRQGRRVALLCVGNWVERKGILDALETLARLPMDAATLHLLGDDAVDPTYAARIRARLGRPDLAGRVVAHGPVSSEVVAAFYQAADVFVLPSYREPYGTVYGEAMAYGLPVVGWRAGNLPHLAQQGVEGLMAEPGDVAGLTDALQRLASDPALRHSLGEAARRRALTRPTWEETARRFFAAVRRVVEEGHPARPGR